MPQNDDPKPPAPRQGKRKADRLEKLALTPPMDIPFDDTVRERVMDAVGKGVLGVGITAYAYLREETPVTGTLNAIKAYMLGYAAYRMGQSEVTVDGATLPVSEETLKAQQAAILSSLYSRGPRLIAQIHGIVDSQVETGGQMVGGPRVSGRLH